MLQTYKPCLKRKNPELFLVSLIQLDFKVDY